LAAVAKQVRLPNERRTVARQGKITISVDTIHVPLTFALIAGLYAYFRRSLRILAGAALVLLLTQLLRVYVDTNLIFYLNRIKVLQEQPSQTLVHLLGFVRTLSFYLIFPFLLVCYFRPGVQKSDD